MIANLVALEAPLKRRLGGGYYDLSTRKILRTTEAARGTAASRSAMRTGAEAVEQVLLARMQSNPIPIRDEPHTMAREKLKIGGGLKERDQLKVLELLRAMIGLPTVWIT